MNCRTWPPFYELEVNGVCVTNPTGSQQETTFDNILGLGLIIGIFVVVGYGITKIKN
jgi:flagellar biogenesis protein FliO